VPDIRARTRLFIAACAGLAIYGIVLALLGTLFGLPQTAIRLHIDLSQEGDLFFWLFAGTCITTFSIGPLIDRLGNKAVLLFSSTMVVIALGMLAVAQSPLSAVVSVFALGIGGGGLNTATNVLVSELYEENRGTMMNILGASYGVGALLMPVLAASLTQFSVPQLILSGAVLPAICSMVYAVLRFPQPREVHGVGPREMHTVLHYPGLLIFALLLFVEAGNEAVIGGWTSTYVRTVGAKAQLATSVLAGYWLAFMLGRVLVAFIVPRFGKANLIVVSAVSSVVGCLVLVNGKSVASVALGVIFTGVAFAGVFPTVLTVIGDSYQRYVGTVFGLLSAVGVLGAATLPWLVGHIAQEATVRSGMAVPLAGACVVSASAVALRGFLKKRKA